MKPKAIVVTGNGTNCEREMAHAVRLAGGEADIVHTSALFGGEKRLRDYKFLNLPGGFLDGDDLGSAKAGAVRFRFGMVAAEDGMARFFDELLEFIDAGGLVLGICNGFQLMVKMGLLPGFDGDHGNPVASLMHNDSGRFEDRWVNLTVDRESPCVFTRGMEKIYVPVRHGEGKFVPGDEAVRERMVKERLYVVKYADLKGEPTMEYPANPNGSADAVAGICDPTGRLFGLMPHPEAFLHRTNHPRWTREDLPEEGQGLMIFRNAVNYLKQA